MSIIRNFYRAASDFCRDQWLSFYNAIFLSKGVTLPDFLIIGAQKSGTTALAVNLQKHPAIYMARASEKRIEIHFFNKNKHWRNGVGWYSSHFGQPTLLQGEKTPSYISNYRAHQRMKKIVPDAKLILLLRNPVDRAYSCWNHFNQNYDQSQQWGWEKTNFEAAMEIKPEIIRDGQYIDQINHLLKFFKYGELCIVIAERIKQNPQEEYEKVCSFLKIPPISIDCQNYHERQYPVEMQTETRNNLLSYYSPYNESLFKLLGYAVDEWSA